jgi:drug/metabolite transporter (DMT)-like permease
MSAASRLSAASALPAARPLVGILMVVFATLTFALADTLTKHLAGLYPVPVIMALRYLVNVVLLAAIWRGDLPRLWRVKRLWLVLLRGLCLAAASLTVGLALKLMPVGETIAIIYLAPFAVMLLAGPVLGERVSFIGWLGSTFGFFGVLLIARPGGNLDPTGVVFALINAALSTAYHLMTRLLARTETTVAMLFHTAWVGAVIFAILALPELPTFAPTLSDLGLMVLLGVLMTLPHFLFTGAYREAPASLLAPVNYVHLLWAGTLGWLVFGHLPDALSLFGMVLIALAGAGIAIHTHLSTARRVAEELPPAAV